MRKGKKIEATFSELAEAATAVTPKFECDYCHKEYSSQLKAAAHVVVRHVR